MTTQYSIKNPGRKEVVHKNLPPPQPPNESGMALLPKPNMNLILTVLGVLVGLVTTFGITIIAKDAKFGRLQEDVKSLEKDMDDLKAKINSLETEQARMDSKLENLQP